MPLSPRAAATHKAILTAARSCFAARGLAATTTREIAKAAGVTQPLVHHYFGSKEALFDAVLVAAVEEYDASQAAQWELPAGDLRFLTDGLIVLFRWLGDHPDLMRLSTWARLEGRATIGDRTLVVYRRVMERLEAAQKAGVVRRGVDLEITIVMIDALFKGYWDRRSLFAAYPMNNERFDDRFLAQSIEALLIGLLTRDAANIALEHFREKTATPP